MNWEEFMNSELLFKSNAHKHVIEVKGSEFDSADTSTILVYCNVYTGYPMIVLVRYSGTDISDLELDNTDYTITKTTGVDDDGNSYTEFLIVLREMQKALEI